jgi:hypothetical protein
MLSYTTSQGNNDFVVTVNMNFGDCQSSCTKQHTWNYSVSYDGTVKLESEQGAQVQASPPPVSTDPSTVHILFVAGPVCPVERNPPDPNCAPRPVPGVSTVLRDPAGNQVATGTSDANGVATFTVPGGAYYVDSGQVGGMMRAPTPTAFSVPGGVDFKVTLEFDTGIR